MTEETEVIEPPFTPHPIMALEDKTEHRYRKRLFGHWGRGTGQAAYGRVQKWITKQNRIMEMEIAAMGLSGLTAQWGVRTQPRVLQTSKGTAWFGILELQVRGTSKTVQTMKQHMQMLSKPRASRKPGGPADLPRETTIPQDLCRCHGCQETGGVL